MGYELEATAPAVGHAGTWIGRRLANRWQRADERLMAAMRAYAEVRRTSQPGDPEWIAAQLSLAEARLRYRECADEIERLSGLLDDSDPHN